MRVERANDRLQVGQEAEARVRLKSRSSFTKIWLEAEDETDMPGNPARTVVTLPAQGTRNWRVTMHCARRGIYGAGPGAGSRPATRSASSGSRSSSASRHQLLVLPRPEELPYFWSPVAQLPGEGTVRRRTHYVTPNASGVREYYPGDSYNRIHWRSTARLGRPMVKTFEMDPTSNVWVLLDLEGAVQAGEGDESTEEYARAHRDLAGVPLRAVEPDAGRDGLRPGDGDAGARREARSSTAAFSKRWRWRARREVLRLPRPCRRRTAASAVTRRCSSSPHHLTKRGCPPSKRRCSKERERP